MTKTPEELTADWKAGKLMQGWYFCKLKNGLIHHFEFNGNDFTDLTCHIPHVAKILAPCNYDEYKAMQEELTEFKRSVTSYVGKPIDYDIACETVNKLLDDKEQLKKELESARWYQTILNEDIAKLRALLKECGEHIRFQLCENRAKHLLTRINAALGESEEK